MAIDFHVHPQDDHFLAQIGGGYDFSARYFGIDPVPISTDEMIAEMDEAGVSHAVIFGAGDTRFSQGKAVSNEHIAALVQRYPDRLIGFGSVDPHFGRYALQELDHLVRELGLRGLKFHPAYQDFHVDDRKLCYPIYERCVELGIPILTHVGTTGLGQAKIDRCRPAAVDSVAQDFPQLTIIMAHAGWPWVEECIAVMLHNPNVYIDLSGYLPRYHPDYLYRRLRRAFPERVLFGTDYPLIRFQRWLKDFEEATADLLDDRVREMILEGNARRLLGLS